MLVDVWIGKAWNRSAGESHYRPDDREEVSGSHAFVQRHQVFFDFFACLNEVRK